MRAAVVQLPSIGMSTTKLYHYVRHAHKNGVKLIVLGEYLLNSFFKEYERTPISMIKEQSEHHIGVLKEMSQTYDMVFVAPIIVVKRGEPYKMIAKIAPNSTAYYCQQLLINYSHWNEEKFFANPIEPLSAPLTFAIDGFRFAVMGGFELHFDELWHFVSEKNVDCVLLPTASTFESQKRWQELVKMRSFTHNCYIFRANRIGEYNDNGDVWNFYGNSLLTSPVGEIEEQSGNKEALLIVDMDHAEVVSTRRTWGFKEALRRRSAAES